MIQDLTCGACISVRSVDPSYVRIFLEEWGVKLDVYEHLLRINAGYDQAIRSLAALRKHGAFHRSTLERFTGDGMMIFFNDPVPIPNPAASGNSLTIRFNF